MDFGWPRVGPSMHRRACVHALPCVGEWVGIWRWQLMSPPGNIHPFHSDCPEVRRSVPPTSAPGLGSPSAASAPGCGSCPPLSFRTRLPPLRGPLSGQ